MVALAAFSGTPAPYNTFRITASGDTSGATDNANFAAAYQAACNSYVTMGSGINTNYVGQIKIQIAPGIYYLTNPTALMSVASPTVKVTGLVFEGAGSSLTYIQYSPSTSGPLCRNQQWRELQFVGMTFSCTDGSGLSNFMQSEEQGGTSNIQHFNYYDVTWYGTWQYIAIPTGGNNNSEWTWDRCTIYGPVSKWWFVPGPLTATMTNGSANIAVPNSLNGFYVGATVTFNTTIGTTPGVSGVSAGTAYSIVLATTTAIQIAPLGGGATIVFSIPSGPSSAVASVAADQFVNVWWIHCKFWLQTGATGGGAWIDSSYGGHYDIVDSDASAFEPSVPTYLFALRGTSHNYGVAYCKVDGVRIENVNNNALLLYCEWPNGVVHLTDVDQSSQVQNYSASTVGVLINIVNVRGPMILIENCDLIGQHQINYNTNNFYYQTMITYRNNTVLQWPTPAQFCILQNNGVNSASCPQVNFEDNRSDDSSLSIGYHEIWNTNLGWNVGAANCTTTKSIHVCNAQGGFSVNGGTTTPTLFPLGARIVRIRCNKVASSDGGAFSFNIQDGSGTPNVLATLSGSNASATYHYDSDETSPRLYFFCTTTANCTISVVDTYNRSGAFNTPELIIDYIG